MPIREKIKDILVSPDEAGRYETASEEGLHDLGFFALELAGFGLTAVGAVIANNPFIAGIIAGGGLVELSRRAVVMIGNHNERLDQADAHDKFRLD